MLHAEKKWPFLVIGNSTQTQRLTWMVVKVVPRCLFKPCPGFCLHLHTLWCCQRPKLLMKMNKLNDQLFKLQVLASGHLVFFMFFFCLLAILPLYYEVALYALKHHQCKTYECLYKCLQQETHTKYWDTMSANLRNRFYNQWSNG